jgi:Icc-related predicted phosphoesterase
MKIDYISDIHYEWQKPHDFSNEAGGDILIMAGDITTADAIRLNRTDKDGLIAQRNIKLLKKQLTDKYKKVLYILGNHEHYRFTYEETLPQLRKSFGELGLNNVSILENDCVLVDDVLFICATLWSDFLKESPNSMNASWNGMNDYRIIATNSSYGTITPQFTLDKHKESRSFIQTTLEENKNKKTVVVTHHGPTMKSLNKKHSGNALDGAYCSDLSEMILDNPQIKYWISGHCHTIMEYEVGDTMVVSNCRGYAGYDESAKAFRGTKSFEV